MGLLIRWAIVAIALVAAVAFVPGIRVEGDARVGVAVMAAVLGLVNAVVRPILRTLACGLILVTLGLFLLVINAATLWFSSYIATEWLGIGFYVDGFRAAFLGGLVVSAVSFVLSALLPDED